MEIFIKRFWLIFLLTAYSSLQLAFSQVFFTPGDDITALCIAMIEAEQKSICGAVYMFTDKKIAQAIVNAHQRGVHIQMILDQISMVSCGKGKFLQEHGVPVFVHRTEGFNPYTMALMHHKFFIFGCNKDDKPLLWTGSWNCTLRATQHNDENVIVLDDQQVIGQYQECFTRLQERLLSDDW